MSVVLEQVDNAGLFKNNEPDIAAVWRMSRRQIAAFREQAAELTKIQSVLILAPSPIFAGRVSLVGRRATALFRLRVSFC